MRATPFDDRLAAVERVFDGWLSEAQGHKLQNAWDRVQRELDERFHRRSHFDRTPVDLRHLDALTCIEKVANAVNLLPGVPGFDALILPRLLVNSEFDSALHECEVATWFKKARFEVEFVPPQPKRGIRTPDLIVRDKGRSTEVECKLKDPIQQKWMTEATYQWLVRECQAVLNRLDRDIELFGLVLGPPDERNLAPAIERIESVASTGFTGFQEEADISMAILINDSPIDIPHLTMPEFASWAASRGCPASFSQRSPLDNGVYRFSNYRGMGVFASWGHTFDQVYESIDDARGQLDRDKLGIAVVTVGAGRESPFDAKSAVYMKILARVISRRVWGGGRNTRLGAIVLKFSSIVSEAQAGPCTYTTFGNAWLCVYKPSLRSASGSDPANIIKHLLADSTRTDG